MKKENSFPRRDFLRAAGTTAAGMAISGCDSLLKPRGFAENEQVNRPRNMLLLMTDQQTWNALSCLGHQHIKTPNLDRLAANGVLFENACCVYPVCTASRGSIHTGRWSHVQGPHLNCGAPDKNPKIGLESDDIIFGNIFHDNGYKTFHHGKWHLGDIRRHSAWNWKPDLENYHPARSRMLVEYNKSHPVNIPHGQSTLAGWPLYMTKACKNALDRSTDVIKKLKQKSYMKIGRTTLPLEADKTVWLTDNLLNGLDSYSNNPFMAVWSVDPPHAEWAVQDPYYSRLDYSSIKLPQNKTRPAYYDKSIAAKACDLLGKEGVREYLRCYYGLVMLVDDQIGRIINKLEQLNQLEDTLILFTSDHGDMNGTHSVVGKNINAFYDEILRVPLIMHWPKGIKKGRRVKTLVNGVDLMPTLLDYAQLPVPSQCQGDSLRRFIEGDEDMHRAAFCERTNPKVQIVQRMIRTQEWKLSVSFGNFSSDDKSFKEQRPPEMFHLTEDPGEEHNLGSDPAYSKVRKEMTNRLVHWMQETNDPWLEKISKLI